MPDDTFHDPAQTQTKLPDFVRNDGTEINYPSADLSEDPASASETENNTKATGKPRDATSQTKVSLSPVVENIIIEPRDNVLRNYSSYTYNIALYMLSPKSYVKMLQKPSSVTNVPKALVARSGGVGNEGGPSFGIDFFIDNLQMTNMAASPTAMAANTNAVQIQFEISEPNGITFLERLKKQSKTALEEEVNYTHTPYLLEITFKGYNDEGAEISGSIKPKYIPIKFVELKFDVTDSGAVYKIEAVPFNHSVLSNISSTIPVNIQVKAGTVDDIFRSEVNRFSREEETVSGGHPSEPPSKQTKTVVGESAVTLQEAINSHFKQETKQTFNHDKPSKATVVPPMAEIADHWEFRIADDIRNAKIIRDRVDALNTPQKTQNIYKQYSSTMKNKVEMDKTQNLFRVNAGTSVVQLMNYVIIASTYISNNLIDRLDEKFNTNDTTDEKVNWFKIFPEIYEFRGWDSIQSRYKFGIRWVITGTGVFYNDYAWAPKTKPKGTGVHKIYDYIFTGKNTEVQNFKLNFNTAYYNVLTLGTGNPDNTKDVSSIHSQTVNRPSSTASTTLKSDDTIEETRSKDLMTNIMNDGVDLIDLDLEILGDPAFIPVGDAFHQPQGNRGSVFATPFLPDGTINYDLTPPYIQVNLKTPTDYDDLTGYADPNKNTEYGSSQFNGVYQVVETNTTFQSGVFSQKLTGFRTKMQPIKDKVGRSEESMLNIERQARKRPTVLGDAIALPPPPTKTSTPVEGIGDLISDISDGIDNTLSDITKGINSAADGLLTSVTGAVKDFITDEKSSDVEDIIDVSIFK